MLLLLNLSISICWSIKLASCWLNPYKKKAPPTLGALCTFDFSRKIIIEQVSSPVSTPCAFLENLSGRMYRRQIKSPKTFGLRLSAYDLSLRLHSLQPVLLQYIFGHPLPFTG